MPPHPIEACYCHVIDAGHANISRLARQANHGAVVHELSHIRATMAILTDLLLYSPHDPRWKDSEHDRYWDVIRPGYLCRADDRSILEYNIAWEFLALATRYSVLEELKKEGKQRYEEFRQLDPNMRGEPPWIPWSASG